MIRISAIRELDSFAENLYGFQRFFGLTVKGVSEITGIAASTLDTMKGCPFSSPSATGCEIMADLFCTTLDAMCSGTISRDSKEIVRMQEDFIKRAGGIDGGSADAAVDDAVRLLGRGTMLPESEAYMLLKNLYPGLIKGIGTETVRATFPRPTDVSETFAENFAYLMNITSTTYRKYIEGTGVSMGNITRYVRGAEPSLKVVILTAKFFRVGVTEILTGDISRIGYSVADFMNASAYSLPAGGLAEHAGVESGDRILTRDEAEAFLKDHIFGLCK